MGPHHLEARKASEKKGNLRLNLKDEWRFLGRSLGDGSNIDNNIAVGLGRPRVA